MRHLLEHTVCAVGLFKAGEALSHRRRAGWLAVSLAGAAACHAHHHRAG